jgi:hypothetical protein
MPVQRECRCANADARMPMRECRCANVSAARSEARGLLHTHLRGSGPDLIGIYAISLIRVS